MILHLVAAADWVADPERPYAPAGLATEGFVHCTADAAVLLVVANRFYRDEPGEFVVLEIDETRLRSEVRWEHPDDAGPLGAIVFPHVYGPLDRDAVTGIQAAARKADGTFTGFGCSTASGPVAHSTDCP